MNRIRRALISVSDKTGLTNFAMELHTMGVEILSTGGTAKALRDAGIPVLDVSDYTGYPEMMGGRVKTLHPKVHGALLARRDNEGDMEDMHRHGMEPIDLLVVNLYPFEATIAREGVTFNDAIESMDIGGPAMLRAGAKNFLSVGVVVDPRDYDSLFEEIKNLGGGLSYGTLSRLAVKAFEHTARYDTIISRYLAAADEVEHPLPETLTVSYRRHSVLRYGENPHQRACAYKDSRSPLNIFSASVLQGRDMSFTNYTDAHAGLMLIKEFAEGIACAIIKHGNPCGVALGGTLAEAYAKALSSDPVSAYGGFVVCNTEVDGEAACLISELYLEAVLAPGFTPQAREALAARVDLRLLEMPGMMTLPLGGLDMRAVAGGVLVQDWDTGQDAIECIEAATRRKPTEDELAALTFALKVCKHVKSNAIVYAFKDRTVGIGIGQPSRVYAARVGAINANESLRGCVAASDGFLPFKDTVEGIRKAGATAIVQPGGSQHDRDIVEAADELGMAMILTGMRHFRH